MLVSTGTDKSWSDSWLAQRGEKRFHPKQERHGRPDTAVTNKGLSSANHLLALKLFATQQQHL